MPLDLDHIDFLENLFNAIDEDPFPMSDWEKGFMSDQRTRYEEYGDRTSFSSKQMNILKKVAGLYGIETP